MTPDRYRAPTYQCTVTSSAGKVKYAVNSVVLQRRIIKCDVSLKLNWAEIEGHTRKE